MAEQNFQERLEQCRKDKAAIEQQEKEILEQIAQPKQLTFGDVVINIYGERRIILFDKKKNCLCAFGRNGTVQGWSDINNDYRFAGQNLFANNLLGLDY